MEHNLAGIREQVLLDKLDDDEFDPRIVDRFINHTQRDIFNSFELSFMEKIFSGSLPTGSTMFTLPSDVALPQRFTLNDPDGGSTDMMSGYSDFRSFNERFPAPSAEAGTIRHWTLYANQIITAAPTDKDYTMTMFYYKKPQTLIENSDVPEIPEEFQELLVLGAFMRIQQRNEDYDLAAQTGIEYQRILNQLVERYGFRKADGPIIMKNQTSRRR